jgi:hypothetical protein
MTSTLFIRAKVIFQTEGLISLLSKGFRFLLPSHHFRYHTYYLYRQTIKERNEADYLPKIQDFTLKTVFTNQQADELAVTMGVDFRSYSHNARLKLDKGAIAFCIFVENEVANIGWVAMTQEAKDAINPLPYRVFFSDKEACTAGTVTIPKYRRKGLHTYSLFKRYQFLKDKGIIASKNVVFTSNIVSQHVQAKFAAEIIAKIHYLKILKCKFYKEIPLTVRR